MSTTSPSDLALGVVPAVGDGAAGLLLATIALHNLPEGMIVTAAALATGAATSTAFRLTALSAFGEPAGALIGAVAMSWSPAALP